MVGDDDDLDLEAQVSRERDTENEEVRTQENPRLPNNTPESGEKDEIH